MKIFLYCTCILRDNKANFMNCSINCKFPMKNLKSVTIITIFIILLLKSLRSNKSKEYEIQILVSMNKNIIQYYIKAIIY